ncbi:hypothetical protein J40TS1_42920 [Paenibacillus montaniterrae]|uniref:Uncharacterized protein n=1 Tax=Paenibacillus montaniterrae TaxID=429341 RepID=A0A920CZM9_9BACL|nr:hypothetical protein J40TS1_42920 [Paenibacillus montaniterrae]
MFNFSLHGIDIEGRLDLFASVTKIFYAGRLVGVGKWIRLYFTLSQFAYLALWNL